METRVAPTFLRNRKMRSWWLYRRVNDILRESLHSRYSLRRRQYDVFVSVYVVVFLMSRFAMHVEKTLYGRSGEVGHKKFVCRRDILGKVHLWTFPWRHTLLWTQQTLFWIVIMFYWRILQHKQRSTFMYPSGLNRLLFQNVFFESMLESLFSC